MVFLSSFSWAYWSFVDFSAEVPSLIRYSFLYELGFVVIAVESRASLCILSINLLSDM